MNIDGELSNALPQNSLQLLGFDSLAGPANAGKTAAAQCTHLECREA